LIRVILNRVMGFSTDGLCEKIIRTGKEKEIRVRARKGWRVFQDKGKDKSNSPFVEIGLE
jgi:hypothetical protein